MKEIGYKLDGRAEQTELVKVKEHFEENIIEVKTLLNKKVSSILFSVKLKTSKKESSTLKERLKTFFSFRKIKHPTFTTSKKNILALESNDLRKLYFQHQ